MWRKVTPGQWLAIAIGASLVWGSASEAFEPHASLAIGQEATPLDARLAQAETGDQGDVETLDEGAPQPTVTAAPSGEDVETLDQGLPPAAAPAQPAGAMTSAAPTYEAAPAPSAANAAPAPAQPTGAALPPGFGTGQVHVSAGRFGFPVGLESCHVGAVTGRAYVGLGCDGGNDMVGHARSFNDFPFVPAASFPFEGDEAFFSNSGVFANDNAGTNGSNDVIVSAGQGANGRSSNSSDGSASSNSKKGTAEKAQRVRTKKSRTEGSDSNSSSATDSRSQKASKTSKSGNASESAQKAKGASSRHKQKTKAHNGNKKHKDHRNKKQRDKGKKRK